MRLSIRALAAFLLLAGLCGPSRPSHAQTGVYLTGFPLLRQQHLLTCESSAASMGTRARVTERQLMAVIPRNPNPNLGFRGNPDGRPTASLVNYGVYANPVHLALQRYSYASDVISYGNDAVLRLYLSQGWPVVAWVTYRLQVAQPRVAAANGVHFILVPHEHAILLVGYDAGTVLANDPWTKQLVRYTWRDFNRSWGYFGNMALAIEPCVVPDAVAGLTVASVTPTDITWSWLPAARAARYQVDIYRVGAHLKSVYSALQTDTSVTLTTAQPGHTYEIDVRAVSRCGGTSDVTRLAVAAPPGPTPSPTEGGLTPTPTGGTPAGTGTPAPTGTTTPTPSPTSKP